MAHGELRVANINIELGFYKKQLVAVKRIRKRQQIEVTRQIKEEFLMVIHYYWGVFSRLLNGTVLAL